MRQDGTSDTTGERADGTGTHGSTPPGARADWGPGVGMRWETPRSGADTGGELLEGTMWFAGHMAGPPVHVHPHASESFRVLEGQIEVFMDGRWAPAVAGETVTVPAGVPHSVRNRAAGPAKLVNAHWPAQQMEGFFLDGGRLASEGKIKALPPKDPRTAIHAAMLFQKYPDDIRATGPQGPLFRVLAAVGRLCGFRV